MTSIKNNLRLNICSLALERLRKIESPFKSEIIRFPNVFQKLGSSFQISKKQCWDLLFLLQKTGSIEIVPYQGIKILESK